MRFDLRKTLGIYDEERALRKSLGELSKLIGIDLGREAINLALSKSGLSKADAVRIGEALITYGESR